MKKGYWVVAYKSISDDSAVKAYGALAVPAVQSFGGRFLTRSTSQVQVHEAGLHRFKRHVISAGRPAFNKPGFRIK